jgi:hypothetical protein
LRPTSESRRCNSMMGITKVSAILSDRPIPHALTPSVPLRCCVLGIHLMTDTRGNCLRTTE